MNIKTYDTDNYKFGEIEEQKPSRRQRSHTVNQKKNLVQSLCYGAADKKYFNFDYVVDNDAFKIIFSFANGTDKDIEYLTKALLYAKKNSLIKELPIYGLVVLSASPHPLAKQSFKKIFDKMIVEVDDLKVFSDIISSKAVRGWGRMIRTIVGQKLKDITVRDAIKYRGEPAERYSNALGNPFASSRLKNLIILSHVRPDTNQQKVLFKWLIGKSVEGSRNIPSQIIELEKMKATADLTGATTTEAVKMSNLPISVIPNRLSDEAVRHLFMNATFEEIIDNWSMFVSKEVFMNEDCVKHASEIFSSSQTIRKSGMLPYEYLELLSTAVDRSKHELTQALQKAIETSYINLPEVDKKVAVLVMSDPDLDKFKLSKMAAAMIPKVCRETDIFMCKSNTETYEKFETNHSEKTLTLYNRLSRTNHAGDGVATTVPHFKRVIREEGEYDTYVLISSGHLWSILLRRTDYNLSWFQSIIREKYSDSPPEMIFWTTKNERDDAEVGDFKFVNGFQRNVVKYFFEMFSGHTHTLEG